MAATNSALQQIPNQLGSDCLNCKMRVADNAGHEDCLMEVIRSQWSGPFGNSSYCSHPDARQFVDFVNSVSA